MKVYLICEKIQEIAIPQFTDAQLTYVEKLEELLNAQYEKFDNNYPTYIGTAKWLVENPLKWALTMAEDWEDNYIEV